MVSNAGRAGWKAHTEQWLHPSFIHQCDQIGGIFVQYMAINNNEIGPIVYIICKSMLRILPNTKLNLCIIAKDFLKRNFAKSGHTAARDKYSLI